MKILLRIKNKTYRILLRIFGLMGLCFLIEACYGVPQNDYASLDVGGTVRNASNEQPIEGLEVQFINSSNDTFRDTSNSNGQYSFPDSWLMEGEVFHLEVNDIDSTNNGEFHKQDTAISVSGRDISANKREVDFNLQEK